MGTSTAAKGPKQNALRVVQEPKKSSERVHADLALNPAVNAAATVQLFGRGTIGKLEITETLEAMIETVAIVRKGDLSGPEATLVAQAASLNSIFTELARRSAANMGEYIEASERYMRLALKAQAQCRATIETLAAMKSPPVVIARQANIANGPQQVNNGEPRAEKIETSPNELLESEHGKRLDSEAASAPVRGDPAMVALEAGHRA